ncbi:MAG: NADH:ubiquinone oxidoreductase [Pseudomonadota bacterium]
MNSNQNQGTMLMVGALAGTVAFVGFLAMMIIGGLNFSASLSIALVLFLVVAVVLVIGFHRKPASEHSTAVAPVVAPAPAAAPEPAPEPVPVPQPEPAPVAAPEPASDPAPAPGEGTKPTTLEAARDGAPDDLKKIKGVGPKLEELLHSMGFYHFDQVANWTAAEVAWVDDNLEGFKGRVSRDDWVAQAKLLASGGETEFSKKVDEGDVY